MKKLLVPIDFSPTSENAFRYALAFSAYFEAEILCLHAHAETESNNESLENFEVFKADTIPSGNVVDVQLVTYHHHLEDAFAQCLGEYNIDLVIMGTQGAKGFNKLLKTSHTTELLSETQLPFLIVPEQYKFKPYEFILWASDFNFLEDDNAIDSLVEIAKVFDAEVRIAHIKTNDKHGSAAQHLERSREKYLFAAEEVKYSFKRIHSKDISDGIDYYLDLKGDNDLLVLVRREHSFLGKLFGRDHTMEFAANPKIPLLILHE